MILFDSHTHLTDEQYEGERDRIVENARNNNIMFMIDVGYNKETSFAAVCNAQKYDGVFATAGLHPENVGENNGDLEFVEELAKLKKIVAIGEIGLDYHYGGNKELQQEIFIKQINIANKYNLPVAIHSRDADMDMLKILKEHKINNKFVMHCFSSSVEVLKEMLKLDAYISIAGPVTFKNARSLTDVARIVPDNRLLIETDAPYLTPEPNRGKRNESAYVIYTAQKIADLRECSLEKIAKITTENAKRFYNVI